MTSLAQKRPLVLLHKSTECATFAIAPSAIPSKESMDIDRIRIRFTQVLGLSSSPTRSAVAKKSMDDDGDDDSAYGSGQSGQNSPDDSPVSRSDSPSPIDRNLGSMVKNEQESIVTTPNRPAFRCRSMSECCDGSPLKGILKRRGPMLRSLSQCDEETLRRNESNESQSLHSSTNDSDNNISESCDDESESGRERSQSIKKTVRFSDRVQENVFRPNSSILGQRKKNQRKQQRKRKRTESGDSQTGESEHEGDQEMQSIGDQEVAMIEDQKEKAMDLDQGDQEVKSGDQVVKSIDQGNQLARSIDQFPQSDQKVNPADQDPQHQKIDTKPKKKPDHQDFTQITSKASRKKVQRENAIKLDDKRYNGFVIGTEKKPRKINHRRHSSGDSGLGDDEGDGGGAANVPNTRNNGDRRRVVSFSCGENE